jgi:signal transduction histidine kinase
VTAVSESSADLVRTDVEPFDPDGVEHGRGVDEFEGQGEIRRWLARELHDSVASRLTAMLIQMEQLKRSRESLPELSTELADFQESTRQVLTDLRRMLHELRGEPADVFGFVDTLRTTLQGFESGTGIRSILIGAEMWPPKLAARVARDLLGIVEEALHNVRDHSAARSVRVCLALGGGMATLRVIDDGKGRERIDERGAFGVVGMRERAVLVGGDLVVVSAPGQGTTVQATFPLERLL